MFQKQNSKFLLFLFIQCITTNKLYICVCIGMGISLSLRIEPFSFLNESYMTSRCHQSENLFSFFYMYSFNSFRMTRTHSYFFSIHFVLYMSMCIPHYQPLSLYSSVFILYSIHKYIYIYYK